MKSLLFLCLITISSFCFGQGSESIRSITVTSEASKSVEPNMGYLVFEISTIDDDISKAKTINDQKIKDILAFLKKQKFAPNDIKTVNVSLSDYLEYPAKPEDRKKQYRASQYFRITLHDLQQYEPVTTELIHKGVIRLNGLQLSHSDLETLKDELVNEALEKARERANSMAKKLNAQAGKVLQIIDEKSLTGPQQGFSGQLTEVVVSGANSSSLSPGTLTIATRVRVVFALN